MASDEQPEVKLDQVVAEVKVLRLQPGDIVVLKSDAIMDDRMAHVAITRAGEMFSKHVGFPVKVMVLHEGADIEVLRSQPDAPQPEPGKVAKPQPLPMPPAGGDAYYITKGPAVCPQCKEPQFACPGGMVCRNGHGY
jgi:hypothetical protein